MSRPAAAGATRYRVGRPVDDVDLNRLFGAAWEGCGDREFARMLDRSLAWVCAYQAGRVVGFVNVAWDGRDHAFILDTVVAPECRRRGIGTGLVKRAIAAAKKAGVAWVHVDYEPHLEGFYRRCGFRPSAAGVLDLRAAKR